MFFKKENMMDQIKGNQMRSKYQLEAESASLSLG